MEYGRIIRRAWHITWRNKVLWVFGIAAALFGAETRLPGGGGQGMQYTLNGQDLERLRRSMPNMPWGQRFPHIPNVDWQQIGMAVLGMVAIALVIGVVVAILRVLVRYTSLGALIGMVAEIESQDATSFKSGLRKGWRRLLHLFAINIILGLAVAILVIVVVLVFGLVAALIAGVAVALSQSGAAVMIGAILVAIAAGLALLLLVIVVSIAVSAAVGVLRELAFRASVLEGEGIIASISAAIAMARKQPQEVFLMWLLMWAIRLGMSIIAIPLVMLAVGLVLIPSIALGALSNAAWPALLAFVPLLLLVLVVAALVQGIYVTFRSSVWTLTFREMEGAQMLAED